METTIEKIKSTVADAFGISVNDLESGRTAEIKLARQMAMYLYREYTNCSLLRIAKSFRRRDQIAVIRAHKEIRQMLEMWELLESIKNKL